MELIDEGWGGATLLKEEEIDWKEGGGGEKENLGGGCSSSSSEERVMTETGRCRWWWWWWWFSSLKWNWNDDWWGRELSIGKSFVVKRRLNKPTNDGGINNWLQLGF